MCDDGEKNGLSEEELKQIWYRRVDLEKEISSRISETTRFIGFGIIAWVFAVNTSSSNFATTYLAEFGFFVGVAGILAVLGVLSDYFQYIFAYRSVDRAMQRDEHAFDFDYASFAYNAQGFFWSAKQYLIGVAGAITAISFALHVVCRAMGC